MKDRLLRHLLRVGMLSALVMAAGMILSLQSCLPPRGRVIVQAPPPVLLAPPFLYVIPGTYAYYVADVDVDFFFYQGFWYRPYLGRWYRANAYNGSWTSIATNRVPVVLREVPNTYRRVAPRSSRLPHHDVQNNWRSWERERYWDRQDEPKRDRNDYRDNGRTDPGPQRQPVILQEQQQREKHPDQDRNEYRDKDKDKDRGRDRNDYRDNSRLEPGPQRQPVILQEQQQREKHPDQDRNEYRDKDKDKDRGRDRNDYRDNSRLEPGPQRQPVILQEQQQREKHPDQDRNEYKDNGRDSGARQPEDRQGLNRDKNQNEGKVGERNVRQDQKPPSEPVRQVTQPQAQQQEKQQTPSKQKQKQKKDKGQKKDEDEDSATSQDKDENRRDERERKGR